MKAIFEYLNKATEELNILIEKYNGLNNIPIGEITVLRNNYPLYNEYQKLIASEKRKLKVVTEKDYFSIDNMKYIIDTERFGNSKEISLKIITDSFGNKGKLVRDKNNKVDVFYNKEFLFTYNEHKTGFSKNSIIDLIKIMFLRNIG